MNFINHTALLNADSRKQSRVFANSTL